ncbi:hypothetical protein ACFFTN_06430 [Aminobacter aganoensis]|uniref:Pyruvate dehydrogenase complex dehydrogenase (E1) component n=1 Tax=Aminobacter aganoensis TaxID=83264 RepID=A0A7X0FDQ2_9HYPH|nr:hypothetical protein [Aminobacter aganoensis]MBB6357548.1 pyruvate dehydrogenase complex dehydrogenase (E1) component [Aminobacter aganoensis]
MARLVKVTTSLIATIGFHRESKPHSFAREHFGQTGSLAELHRHYSTDSCGIASAAEALTPGRPVRNLSAV